MPEAMPLTVSASSRRRRSGGVRHVATATDGVGD